MEEQAENAKEAKQTKKTIGDDLKTSLVEIGPRFVLEPIRIFRGSFGGQTVYKNDEFVSPNEGRAMMNQRKGRSYADRKMAEKEREERHQELVLPEDPLADVFR